MYVYTLNIYIYIYIYILQLYIHTYAICVVYKMSIQRSPICFHTELGEVLLVGGLDGAVLWRVNRDDCGTAHKKNINLEET